MSGTSAGRSSGEYPHRLGYHDLEAVVEALRTVRIPLVSGVFDDLGQGFHRRTGLDRRADNQLGQRLTRRDDGVEEQTERSTLTSVHLHRRSTRMRVECRRQGRSAGQLTMGNGSGESDIREHLSGSSAHEHSQIGDGGCVDLPTRGGRRAERRANRVREPNRRH